MEHEVLLLRNDMKWKPIHNIHTYIHIFEYMVYMYAYSRFAF